MPNLTSKKTLSFGRTAAEVDREELIRSRAHELYEAHGCGDGHGLQDWLEAEAEITGRTEEAGAA